MADVHSYGYGPSQYGAQTPEITGNGVTSPILHNGEKSPYHQHVASGIGNGPTYRENAPAVAPSGANPGFQGGKKWEPGFFARLPWLGFAALGLSLCCEFLVGIHVVSSDIAKATLPLWPFW